VCGLRPGRNPWEHSRQSCSTTALSTHATACCTSRSSIVRMPNGRRLPFPFGMYTRRIAGAW
jgi:hypothetical protein